MTNLAVQEIAAGEEIRRSELGKELDLIVAKEVTEKIKIALGDKLEKVILFGSRARGDARSDSDYDFVVIGRYGDTSFADRIIYLNRLVGKLGYNIDYIPCTEEEFQRKFVFSLAVKKEGIILFMDNEVGEWLKRAEDDWDDAKSLAAKGSWNNACFHCQQSAEKYLKAVIRDLGEQAPRSHDLNNLCDIVIKLGVQVPTWVPLAAGTLNGLDVIARYPGYDATEGNAQQAGMNAKKIIDFALEYFNSNGLSKMNVFEDKQDPQL